MNKKIKEKLLRKGWVGCFHGASHKFAVSSAIGSSPVRQRSRIDASPPLRVIKGGFVMCERQTRR
jgi:hypothetical protein